MKYLDTNSECNFEIIDDLQFSNLEDGFNYLARLECQLWTDGEIVKHLWTKTSNCCETVQARLYITNFRRHFGKTSLLLTNSDLKQLRILMRGLDKNEAPIAYMVQAFDGVQP